MYSRWNYVAQITVLSSLVLILPSFLCANTVYTYTSSSGDVSFDLTINADSIPSGTNVDADIVPESFSYPAPAEDNAGFPLGSGSAYDSFNDPTIEIGTNSVGEITSWDITGTQFASYPAAPPFDNPTGYFCEYSVTFTPSGGGGSLATGGDHDADFCPSSTVDVPAGGSWMAVPLPTTPEPRNSALIGGGLLGLVALVTRRKRAAIAR